MGAGGLSTAQRRVALVHDYLLVMRGAERTFREMAAVWPEAPVHTLLYDEAGTHGAFADRTVVTSPLQRLGVPQDGLRALLPLYSTAIASLNLEPHDGVVSSRRALAHGGRAPTPDPHAVGAPPSSAFAPGVRPAPGAQHVCYCPSPFRYAWHAQAEAMREVPAPARPVLALALRRHRRFDRRAVSRLTGLIANSR